MSRYINKDELIEKIEKVIAFYKHYIDNCNFEDDFIHSIEGMDEADVEEVKHGKWVDLGDSGMCSECKGTKLKEFGATYGKAIWAKSKYCPNCGTKMDL